MFFFYGWGTKADRKNLYADSFCKICNAPFHFQVVIQYDYFSLFFIPIIKWNKRYYLECPRCGNAHPIDKQTYLNIKEGLLPQSSGAAPAAQAAGAENPFGEFEPAAAPAASAPTETAAATAETTGEKPADTPDQN